VALWAIEFGLNGAGMLKALIAPEIRAGKNESEVSFSIVVALND